MPLQLIKLKAKKKHETKKERSDVSYAAAKNIFKKVQVDR